MPLRGASVATLRLFNYPAILELSAIDGMSRFALLVGLEDGAKYYAIMSDSNPANTFRLSPTQPGALSSDGGGDNTGAA